MAMQNVMAGLAVSNIQTATSWYTKLLGRGPTAMSTATAVEWEFPGGGWLRVYEKAEKAGTGSLTIMEDDLESRMASLQTAHITIDKERVSDGSSIAVVADPDGNRIIFEMLPN